MSLFLDGIGAFVKKVVEYIPGRKESKENQIERLTNENVNLAKESPLSAKSADRIHRNLDTIDRLQSEISRIT